MKTGLYLKYLFEVATVSTISMLVVFMLQMRKWLSKMHVTYTPDDLKGLVSGLLSQNISLLLILVIKMRCLNLQKIKFTATLHFINYRRK